MSTLNLVRTAILLACIYLWAVYQDLPQTAQLIVSGLAWTCAVLAFLCLCFAVYSFTLYCVGRYIARCVAELHKAEREQSHAEFMAARAEFIAQLEHATAQHCCHAPAGVDIDCGCVGRCVYADRRVSTEVR